MINILNMPPSNPYGLSYEFLTTHIKETDIGKFSELISTLLVELADEGEVLRNSLVNDLRVLLWHKESLFKNFRRGKTLRIFYTKQQ